MLDYGVSMSAEYANDAACRTWMSIVCIARMVTSPFGNPVASYGFARTSSAPHSPINSSDQSANTNSEQTDPDVPLTKFERS